LSSTTKLVAEAGARAGGIYGRFRDIDIYRAVLDGDFQVFTSLTDELTRELVENETSYVVGDAVEGYNPAHDVCRMIINAAVELSKRRHGHEIANFDFLLVGNPAAGIEMDRAICVRLDAATHSQKLAAAAEYTDLNRDVGSALGSFGADAFQVECFRPVSHQSSINPGLFDEPPFYEQYGEGQVSRGYYDRVLRHRQHMVPLSDALNSYVERNS
jgi:AcrR family transcriptional regulator